MDYSRACQILMPAPAQWTCGDTYASIRRLDGGQVPTDAALIAAFASYVPVKSWATYVFLGMLTAPEETAIIASDDPIVKRMRFHFDSHPTVESNNPELIAGLAYLVSIGILTADRPAALLA
jgi:hypothetical protein